MPTLIPGYATPQGTQQWANKASSQVETGHYRADAQQLMLTSLGMGTYLGEPDKDTTQRVTEAVLTSLDSGAVNVLDTASNYRYQLGERAIGQALATLEASQSLQRDGLFVASKMGYLTPDADDTRPIPTYFKETLIDTGILPTAQVVQGCHSLHPTFLQHQLAQSRHNLGLNTLDLMYLHNVAESQLPEVTPTQLMARLEAAFDTLETARQQGHIRFYGLATWDCFRVPPSDDGFLSLLEVVKLAESVGGTNHGLRYIQLPFNLAMPEASTELFQQDSLRSPNRYPVLRVAESLGIGVFTSVPLYQGNLLGQPGLPSFPGLSTPAQQCLQAVRCTPGIIAPVVGHKQTEHVRQNLLVAQTPVYQVSVSPCH
jgi:aryl-alcohol dehydrogenase-like predicted oxidoreductase